jgi:hypothetical protein
MMKKGGRGCRRHQPMVYKIRVKGCLDKSWSDWFDGLEITSDEDETLLCGPVVDQTALHGLLKKVRDLGLHLILVEQLTTRRK